MFRALAEVLVVATLLSQFYSNLDRNDIHAEFGINLDLKIQILAKDLDTATDEMSDVIHEIVNSTSIAVLNASTQIQDTLDKIGNAKRQTNSTEALACIEDLENLVGELSGDDIAKACPQINSTSEMGKTIQEMYILSEIPKNTFETCQDLNPFPTQNKSFLECVIYNILDLNVQRRILQGQFSEDKQNALDQSWVCLSQALASITQQISDINFQLGMCILM